MAIVVNMPRLSDTMEEGVVAKWHKSVGDQVNEGDLLAEIETDKATMEFEAMPGQEGELLYIGVEEGGTSPVDAVLCILGAKGEDIEALKTAAPSAEAPVTKAEPKAEEAPAPVKDEPKSTPAPAAAPVAAAVTTASSANGRVVASPLAKKLAQEKGIDIALVNGSGEGGRVVKRDIDNYVPSAAPTASVAMADNTYEEVAVSQMRKTIARRLSDSKFSAPHFYLTMEIDMDNAIKARKQMNAGGDVRISFNDLVVKAAALALRQHKAVNAGWYGDTIRYYNYINVGIAVAVDEGLLVPVVRNTDFQSLSQISTEVRRLAGMAKDKKLQPSDWEGNTFTISNLGMFGIDEFTAIINSPDAAILAVGGINQVPVVKNGEIVPGNTMKVTLSCDHRVIDGATGAAFLQTLKGYLENPVTMLV
jgi:pyruvate dehydrogenase E2 component (dihydrolipoamide acetyltransferase)